MPNGPANDQCWRGGAAASASCADAARMPRPASATATVTAMTRLRFGLLRLKFMARPLTLGAGRRRRRRADRNTVAQHRFGDRVRQRVGFFEQSQERQDDEEEGEIVDG